MKIEFLELSNLTKNPENRDIRTHIVEKIRKGIEKKGFNPAAALSVKKINGSLIIADGNHRFEALSQLQYSKPIPCVIYNEDEENIFTISTNGNEASGIMATVDLFDTLKSIQVQKEQGITLKEIAVNLGVEEPFIKEHSRILSSVVEEVLDLAKTYQEGRSTKKVLPSTFNFTANWFKESGIYDLKIYENSNIQRKINFQSEFMNWFCLDRKCKAGKVDIDKKVDLLKTIQEQLRIVDEKLLPACFEKDADGNLTNDAVAPLYYSVIDGNYASSQKRLEQAIEAVNESVASKAYFGVDCLEQLKDVKDGSISCVITDPPWGVDYKPSRPTGKPVFDNDVDSTIAFLDDVFKEIKRVCVEDAHIYVFYPTVHHQRFLDLLNLYFDVDPIPLIWAKNNHTPCDFSQKHASDYETVFFCKMKGDAKRPFNKPVSPYIHTFSKPTNKYHDCQKPVDLLEDMIRNSTAVNEIVLDPFAGSGSTLIAAKKANRTYLGYEKETSYQNSFLNELEKINGRK